MLLIKGQNLSCTQVLSNDSFCVKIINAPKEKYFKQMQLVWQG